MNAMPQPRPDHSEPAAPPPGNGDTLASAIPGNVVAANGTPPPHLLWATLESAYAAPEQSSTMPSEERLPPYIALPMAVGLSLVLWVIIVELVLMH